ncbi:MAG: IS66 family transposase [Terriglobales bacterium]
MEKPACPRDAAACGTGKRSRTSSRRKSEAASATLWTKKRKTIGPGPLQSLETRWLVFIDQQGKTGHGWWLGVFVGQDSVAYRLDPSRSHDVPQKHFAAETRLVLRVDRYSAYKAMAQVKAGFIILVFCWAPVRREFVQVGNGWPELKEWAWAWLCRIRAL